MDFAPTGCPPKDTRYTTKTLLCFHTVSVRCDLITTSRSALVPLGNGEAGQLAHTRRRTTTLEPAKTARDPTLRNDMISKLTGRCVPAIASLSFDKHCADYGSAKTIHRCNVTLVPNQWFSSRLPSSVATFSSPGSA